MTFRRWLRQLTRAVRPAATKRSAPCCLSLCVESLEERTLLTAASGSAIAAGLAQDYYGPGGQITGPLAPLGQHLAFVYEEFTNHQATSPNTAYHSADSYVQVLGNAVVVDAVAKSSANTLQNDLAGLGAAIYGQAGAVVSALVPITALPQVAGLASLSFTRAVPHPILSAASPPATISGAQDQGDVAQDSAPLRSGTTGLSGKGVTVGVLSNSFNDAVNSTNANFVPTKTVDEDIASGDLPGVTSTGTANPDGYTTPVNVLADGSDTTNDTDEGRAMLQIVHDIAPAANLAFSTANGGQAAFAKAIGALRNAGAGVIVDDVLYPDEPLLEDGIIAQAINLSVGLGTTYFTAAGNNGNNSYEHTWQNGNQYNSDPTAGADTAKDTSGNSLYPNAPTFRIPTGGNVTSYAFTPGSGGFKGTAPKDLLEFSLKPGASVSLTVQWDQPWASATNNQKGSQTDLDAYVLRENPGNTNGLLNHAIVGGLTTDNLNKDADETFTFTNNDVIVDSTGKPVLDAKMNVQPVTQTFDLLIDNFSGNNPGFIKFVNFWNGNTDNKFQFYTGNDPTKVANPQSNTFKGTTTSSITLNAGTINGHANAALATAVGAADYTKTPMGGKVSPPVVESFSSYDGNQIYFDVNGNRLTTPQSRPGIAFVAPDGVNTTFFDPTGVGDTDTPTDGFPNFFGTSAAAPSAAGGAALLLQGRSDLQPSDVLNALSATAISMSKNNPSAQVGAGLLDVAQAFTKLPTLIVAPPPPSTTPPPTSTPQVPTPVGVTIMSVSQPMTHDTPIPLVVTFNQGVTGFSATDVLVANGTVTGFTAASATTYDVDVTPTAPGLVTVDIPAGVAQAADGSPNGAPAEFRRTFDNTSPSAVIMRLPTQNPFVTAGPVNFQVIFSEPILTFTGRAVQFPGPASATRVTVTQTGPLDGTTYLVTLDGLTGGGDLSISLPAGAVTDLAGNPNFAAATMPGTSVTFFPQGSALAVGFSSVPGSNLITNVQKRFGQMFVIATNTDTGAQNFAVAPFGSYKGPLTSTVAGDFNHDGIPDVVAIKAKAGSRGVKILDGLTGAVLSDLTSSLGSNVKNVTADLVDQNNDGTPDLVLTVRHKKHRTTRLVFNGKDLSRLA
jgi:Bacterial Ig-like domain/Subtilase family